LLFICILAGQTITSQDIIKPDAMDWLPKNDAIQAGAILVPENHDNPDGKKIYRLRNS